MKARGILSTCAVLSAIHATLGVGPYPGLVPEAAWVHAAARTIQEDGAEQFLVNMLQMLRESFEHAHLQFGEAEDE